MRTKNTSHWCTQTFAPYIRVRGHELHFCHVSGTQLLYATEAQTAGMGMTIHTLQM